MRRLVLLVAIFLFSALAFPVMAETSIEYYQNAQKSGDVNFANWSATSLEYAMLGIGTAVLGKVDKADGDRGLVGGTVTLMAALYDNPAATTQTYLADVMSGMGVPTAYAQGTGFSGLLPIVNIWKAFRNVAYIFYVLIFLAVGFLVMFRFRIDPRTVVTVQNSLPRIILSLLLVTFSFAIAGFLIDVMYVVSYLFFSLLEQATGGLGRSVAEMREFYQGYTLWSFRGAGSIGQGLSAASIQTIVSGIFGGGVGGAILGGIAFGLAWAIIGIAILFVVVRVFLTLLNAYIQILLGVVFAPFWIMLGGLPLNLGSLGFGGWLRHMVGNLAAFPTTAGMFLLGSAFMNAAKAFKPENVGTAPWVAPLLGGGYGADVIMPLIGIGFIFLTPAVVKMTKDAFKSPEFKYSGVIGASAASGMAPFQTAVGVPLGFAIQGFGMRLPYVIPGLKRIMGVGPEVAQPIITGGGVKKAGEQQQGASS